MKSTNVGRATRMACALLVATPVAAADHTVVQRSKSFGAPRLVVSVGDTIKFVNLDDVPHNAFSLSKTHPFDTGMLTRGNSKDVTFSKAGVVEVECAVHPSMTMTVEVRP
jgi:plastocyanin